MFSGCILYPIYLYQFREFVISPALLVIPIVEKSYCGLAPDDPKPEVIRKAYLISLDFRNLLLNVSLRRRRLYD